eukprot:4893025-Amphidinium_carterae.1
MRALRSKALTYTVSRTQTSLVHKERLPALFPKLVMYSQGGTFNIHVIESTIHATSSCLVPIILGVASG